MMFTISKTQKKMRTVSDICAACHKDDFGERFFLRNTKRLFTIKTVNKKGYPYFLG